MKGSPSAAISMIQQVWLQ